MAELAALGAALCWALASLVAAGAARTLGGVAFTRVRMVLVTLTLGAFLAVAGAAPVAPGDWAILVASGIVGIFVGDTALFVTLERLGPRRTAILFSANAPFTLALAWLVLDESLSAPALAGCALVGIGVVVAIAYGVRPGQRHAWESVRGPLWIGVSVGLVAALGQSVGSLLAKPVLEHGTDAVTVAAVRIAAALAALYAMRVALPARTRALAPLSPALFGRLALSGLLGMALGMTLLLWAFEHGSVGLSAALSSTTPVLMVPLIWLVSRERPAAGAWLGAALAVAGAALICLR